MLNLRTNIRNARFIGDVVAESGNPGRLFAFRRIVFVLDIAQDIVVTVYPQDTAPEELRQDLLKVALKHTKKSTREIKKARKDADVRIAELKVKIAEFNLRKAKTSSTSISNACEANVKSHSMEIDEIRRELTEMESKHRRVMKGVAAYV